jgi:hypothetical protein
MKSLLCLLTIILDESGMKCGTTTTSRDLEYITRRVEQEGDSFITITLPAFSDDFDKSLEEGYISPTSFRSFRKDGLIPRLFSGITVKVFDKTSGKLLDQPDVTAILCIRQICRFAKKVLLPCKKERDYDVIHGYIKNEDELAASEEELTKSELYSELVRFSRVLLPGIFGESLYMDHEYSSHSTVRERILGLCTHGPGAVAEGYPPHRKYRWEDWPTRLDSAFPFTMCSYNSEITGAERAETIRFVPIRDEKPVKVTLVPKTMKGSRVIAIEPCSMQYAQQGLMRWLVHLIENRSSLVRGKINFSDQSINGRLALLSSQNGYLATMDLKDASDRVLSCLVYDMFSAYPDFRDMLFACRSTRASLPDRSIFSLRKFASMGSALCFPIESLVFYTILLFGRWKQSNLPLQMSALNTLASDIYVYGDDIVIPANEVPTATKYLEFFKLKVNRNKTFCTGKFRESCGVDAYDGVDITPVYLRRKIPSGSQSARELVSLVSCSNQFYKKKWYATALAIEEFVQSLRRFPYVREQSPCVGFVRTHLTKPQRWNQELQRGEIFAPVLVPRKVSDPLDGDEALMSWFIQSRDRLDKPTFKPLSGLKDYERSVGRGRLTLKSRWSAI